MGNAGYCCSNAATMDAMVYRRWDGTMTDPVINDLNRHIKRMDDEAIKEGVISARVEELLSEGGDFYPWSPENMLEALANIDPASNVAVDMAAYGGFINAQRFFDGAQHAIIKYWTDMAVKIATASFDAEEE